VASHTLILLLTRPRIRRYSSSHDLAYADATTCIGAHTADAFASESKLESIVTDINAHHHVVAHPLNPTPVWLKDQLVNQWSHFHMLMWYRDGRLREYEAWSCDDVDSVHNDYQRHLLYLWAFPEFECVN
jgi:hypothetical protein